MIWTVNLAAVWLKKFISLVLKQNSMLLSLKVCEASFSKFKSLTTSGLMLDQCKEAVA